MRDLKGFAILLSLLLVLILTIFGYWILLLVEQHYSATRLLYDSENARILSDAAAAWLVLQHNEDPPGFFTDPHMWNGLEIKPFVWNGYRITGNLSAPWNSTGLNLIDFRVQRSRSYARMQLPVRQIRFEDFALFGEFQQSLFASSLFDGMVFVRGGLNIDQPVRFRESVHNDVSPEFLATFARPNAVRIGFTSMDAISALPDGLKITGKDPRFWQTDHYQLDLDRIQVARVKDLWEVRYGGIAIGQTGNLILSFDDSLSVSQTYAEIPTLPTGKQEASLYVASSGEIHLNGSIQTLQMAQSEHPLCFLSLSLIRVNSEKCAIRMNACLISSGGVQLDSGTSALADAEKQSWISEIQNSGFILEPEKKGELLKALQENQKMIWIRGSISVKGSLITSQDILQLHFEACRKVHSLIPSFPFVQIVEGKKRWL